MVSPVTSDDEIEHNAGEFLTPTEEDGPRVGETRPSQPSHGRGGAALGAGAGAAGIGAAAALASRNSSDNITPRRARDAPDAAPHTSYNMGNAGPFNEKSTSDERALLGGAAGAGAGASAANRSYKPLNEGSRGGWSDSHGAGAGAGRSAGGSALGRSWRAHKKRWIIGLIVLLVVIIAAAVGGGVAGSGGSSDSTNRASNGGTSGSDTGSGSGSGNGGTTTGTAGIGPLDSRLSRSFYGINYSPQESNFNTGCGANITGVMHDVTILSQLTSRVRLVGSACNETALVLDAIDRLGVDMQVYPGVILASGMTATSVAFTRQLDNISYAFDTFGTANIGGVYVGDEWVTSMGSATQLQTFITAFRDLVADNTAWGSVLVGSTETSSTWTAALARQVDFVFANDESFDEGEVGAAAAAYAYSSFQDFVVDTIADATNDPPSYISAIGWPSASQLGTATTVSSVANVQAMLDAYVCEANTNGTGYFWYELYDASTAEIEATSGSTPNTAIAGYWGLFDEDKNLKDLTLPDCTL